MKRVYEAVVIAPELSFYCDMFIDVPGSCSDASIGRLRQNGPVGANMQKGKTEKTSADGNSGSCASAHDVNNGISIRTVSTVFLS